MLPKGFREGHDGTLACPHRDCSTCPECVARHPQIVDGLGVHYWIADPSERSLFRTHVAWMQAGGNADRKYL